MATSDPLATEKAFLESRGTQLEKRYPGQFVLISGESVLGAFETREEAVVEGTRRLHAGPFLVRSVVRREDPEAPSIPFLSVGLPFRASP